MAKTRPCSATNGGVAPINGIAPAILMPSGAALGASEGGGSSSFHTESERMLRHRPKWVGIGDQNGEEEEDELNSGEDEMDDDMEEGASAAGGGALDLSYLGGGSLTKGRHKETKSRR